jgi:hypothetical protein
MQRLVFVLCILHYTFAIRGVIPERIACEPNLEECKNSVCNFTKVDQFKLIVSFGCDLTKVHSKLSVSDFECPISLICLIFLLPGECQSFPTNSKESL